MEPIAKLRPAIFHTGNNGQEQTGRIWNFSAITYSKSCVILIEPTCFAFQFTNIGDVKATINGMIINPSATPATSLGDSRALSAHLLDIFRGNLNLAFDALSAGTAPLVEVVQLFYAESYERK